MKHRRLITCAVLSLAITIIAACGMLRRPDRWLQDKLYQTPSVASEDIVVIGIDQRALSRFGSYNNWDRNIMASALEALASDPDQMPSVTVIDTLYSGNTNPEADARLVNAISALPDVVVASAAEFGTTRSFGSDMVTVDDYSIINYDEPFTELKDVCSVGHINAMYDNDGIMRHAVLYLDVPDGKRVYSMAYTAASLFAGDSVGMPPVNSRGQFYVPFTCPPGGYSDDISIADLIEGEIDPSYYAGKIVIIGPYASALTDDYFTPIDYAAKMYGVEFQANVIQSLLEQNYKKEIPDIPQLILLFVISFLLSYPVFGKKVKISAFIYTVSVAAGLGISVACYNAGLVVHAIWIPLSAVALFIISIALHYVKAAIERQQVTRTFERYVAPNIVSEILKEGTDNLSLGGKLCDIAVLFVDIRGFTTMSERLDPQKIVFILNKYLTMTSNVIENNNGTLDKFVGDATMAFWGAPLEHEDPVYYACKAALEIVEGASRVSDELKSEIGEELRVGVGVHFGPAVVGNMGSERHMDYTAIGDTVNTSARLEANAPGGTVYISRVVADKLEGRATFTSLGDSIKLKGKADGFEVLKLESLSGR